jgi:hypothetical protein
MTGMRSRTAEVTAFGVVVRIEQVDFQQDSLSKRKQRGGRLFTVPSFSIRQKVFD